MTNNSDSEPSTTETDSAYLSALNLQQSPFSSAHNDSFFYADPALMQRLDLLQHLVQFGELLLLVNGEVGSGKTTLLHQFVLRRNDNWRLCNLQGGDLSTSEILLHKLCDVFGTGQSDKPEQAAARLSDYFDGIQQSGQLAVLTIDDAEKLTDEVLALLLSLSGTPQKTLKHLRILLFTTPSMEQRLQQMGLHSTQASIVYNLDIPRFEEEQTAAYLMYRLAVAGYSGDSPFSASEIHTMHKAAAGLPARLNNLAEQALKEQGKHILSHKARRKGGSAKQTNVTGADQGQRPWLKIGLLFIFLAGVFAWLQDDINRLFESGSPESSFQELPLPEPLLLPQVAIDSSERDKESTSIDTATITEVYEPEPVPELAPSEPSPVAVPVEPEIAASVEAETPTESNNASIDTEPVVDDGRPVTQTIETESTVETSKPGQAEVAELDKPVPDEKAEKVATPESEIAMVPAESPTLDLTPHAKWLLSQPVGNYTLQVLGVSKESSALAFIKKHGLKDQIGYFKTLLRDADWYVVTQGSYPDYASAKAASAKLPAAIRKNTPWIRKLDKIHSDIHKARP